MRVVGAPRPVLAGSALALALFVAFSAGFVALSRPAAFVARSHLIEEPFFAHWSAALGASIPTSFYAIAKPPSSARSAKGRASLDVRARCVRVALSLSLGASSCEGGGLAAQVDS